MDSRADARRWPDLGLIALVWLGAGVLLRPFQNTPFIDDWVYAWPVKRLLQGGDLRILDYSSSPNPVQVLWGLLFCVPFGFSFTALRVATWIMGLLGLWGMYALLRDQGVSRRDALLGTACLGAFPIYLVLSFSFMTEIPFVTCVIWASLAFLRAMRGRSDRWLWVAIGLSCAAIGIRIAAASLPLAMVLALLIDRDGWGRRQARFLWPVSTLVVLAAMTWWFQRHVEVVTDLSVVINAPATRLTLLNEYGLQLLPTMSVVATTFLAQALGLALLPVSVGIMSARRRVAAVSAMVLLCLAAVTVSSAGSSHAPPFTEGQIWWPGELGAAAPLVPDYDRSPARPWWAWLVTAVTLASVSVLVERAGRRLDTPHTFLLLQLFGQLVLVALLWLVYDRYALVLVPVALVLILRCGPIDRPKTAGALVLIMALSGLVGVRDHLEYNRALWTAVAHLERLGIAPADFDGGYTVNGWLQYAHPERARRDAGGAAQVPGVNTSEETPYRISNRARPGWKVLVSIPYRRWATRSGQIYVLEQPHQPRLDQARKTW